MPTKRTVLVTALIALLVAASGCSALSGGSDQGKEIAQQTQEAMQNVDSYTFDMTMTMSSQQSDQSIDMTATGAINVAEERMRMEMQLLGQSMTQYIIGDTQYMKSGGTWQQQDISSQNIWKQQQLAQQQQILENASVTLEGNTTIDGTQVYNLSVDISEEQLMNVIQQQQGQNITSQISVDDISYSMYVTHDDYYLKRTTADMSMSAQGQSLDADLEMTFADFNGNVSVELPPEAENAQSTAS